MLANKNGHKRKHKRIYATVFLLLLILAVTIPLYLHSNSNKDKKVEIITTANTGISKKDDAKKSNTVSQNGAVNSTKSEVGSGSNSSQSSSAQSTPPSTPSGVFVSNHTPSISGSSVQQSEESVCNTSPGASCYIEFIQGAIVKQLPAQTANSSGSTYWSWNINQAGLTEGTWSITAVASLNGQSVNSQDSNSLKVQQ